MIAQSSSRCTSIGAHSVDFESCTVSANGASIHIEPRLADLLWQLVLAEGETVSRDTLVEKVWDGRPVGDDAINSAISKLRTVLQDESRQIIQTVPKRGYRLVLSNARKSVAALCAKGEAALDLWEATAALSARSCFEVALEAKRDNPRSLAGLALAIANLCLHGLEDATYKLPDAERLAILSVGTERAPATGQLAVGVLTFLIRRDCSAALRAIDQALSESPALVAAWVWRSQIELAQGRFDHAIDDARRAVSLEPFGAAIRANLVAALFVARRYEDCIAHADRDLEKFGESIGLLAYKAWAQLFLGNADAAVNLIEGSWRAGSGRTESLHELRSVYDREGIEAFFAALAEMTGSTIENDIVRPVDRAILWSLAGEPEKAVELLELAARRSDLRLRWINVLPQFERLHGMDSFVLLCERHAPPRPIEQLRRTI